jgi:hypothetical protein
MKLRPMRKPLFGYATIAYATIGIAIARPARCYRGPHASRHKQEPR